MSKKTTILFDFDGVITNTEPQYDIYFNALAEKYNLGIDNFAFKIKGVTMPNIIEKYFSHFSQDVIDQILKETDDFEKQMDFQFVPGADAFIEYVKNNNYKIGLVTSSREFKLKIALEQMGLTNTFDTIVTANRITQGKPDPMCYLLGAKDLQSDPSECVVFEDALSGIQAGTTAGMRVIGLSTTIPADQLNGLVYATIPDFTDIPLVLSYLD
ncbi:HAD family phosphatase [Dysgonomonas sp. 216]|uniref:HAD family hydrolase n=1 Tax=Dysgonomonas sp. 216 TaxID=2302934 RepID=UPI0013CF5C1B|nr:HAD family phosphatase [Dysgonomonas sp. 216]NDW18534.1 HAD family phosphatase [Dysgonomonas sp. 216]